MPLQRMHNLDEAGTWFNLLDGKVAADASLGHYNINIEAENFFRDLLNLIFGWSLTNSNLEKQNHGCFDLFDAVRGIAVQVTSVTGGPKIRKTLDSLNTLPNHGIRRLLFVYPRLEKASLGSSAKDFAVAAYFNAAADRLDLRDLLREMRDLDADKQREALELIRTELRPLNLGLFSESANNLSEVSLAVKQVGLRKLFRDSDRPTVAIIGLGFAGVTTAIRILELGAGPLNLLLLNSNEQSQYGGLAYGTGNCGWEHLLNIQAGRISLYRERPTDFLDWINATQGVDKSGWPTEFRFKQFTASSGVPRLIYGQYLKSRLEKSRDQAAQLVDVVEVKATVTKVTERINQVELTSTRDSRETTTTGCDRIVVATGHSEPVVPEFLRGLMPDPSIIATPYSQALIDRSRELSATDTVLVIGTGLTSYDAVLTLTQNDFRGKITMVSRHGFTHGAYPGDHSHEIYPLPFPALPTEYLSTEAMIELFEREVTNGINYVRVTHPTLRYDSTVIEERVLKALEPWLAKLIQHCDPEQVRQFLDLLKSRLTTRRTSVVHEVDSAIRGLRRDSSRLELVPATVESVERRTGKFTVVIRRWPDDSLITLHPSLILCCLGANTDYSKSEDPLWSSLIGYGAAKLHSKTGRGVSVDEYGALIRPDDSVSERMFAVGPMRQGDEIERRGRLGAFVFSIGTLRNQALLAAVKVLALSEHPGYASLDKFRRREVDDICDFAFAKAPASSAIKRLVSAVLAARLGRLPASLEPSDTTDATSVEELLGKHLNQSLQEIIARAEGTTEVDRDVLRHALWYRAHMDAAISATDIRRLASDHHRVRKFGTQTSTEFTDERLACSTLLRSAVALFGASTGSLLIFSTDRGERQLFPFAMYRRVESFTPTPYGRGVAGRLVKAYLEGEMAVNLTGVNLFRANGAIIGAFVADYNMLDSEVKKETYSKHKRRFPSVLLALLKHESNLLGVAYLEREKGMTLDAKDARLLGSLMETKCEVLKRAQVQWDHRSRLYYSYGNFDGADLEGVDFTKQDLRQAIFRNAEMTSAILTRADLTNSDFDGADLSGAQMDSAIIVGASFKGARLIGAQLAGADIKLCSFNQADLSDCELRGAKLTSSTFDNCNLSGVVFRDADVSKLSFRNAVMRNCVFSQLRGVELASWGGADLTNSQIDKPTWKDLPEAIRELHRGNVQIVD